MKYSYKIHQNIYEDAWNWWQACNHSSHGVVWRNQIKDKLAAKLTVKTQKEANKVLLPYLRKLYKEQKIFINKRKKYFAKEFASKFQRGCEKIEKVMGKPLYRQDFTIFLTTLRRGPYYKQKGYVWTCIYWEDPIECFLHELCHFQFIHYWRENKKSKVAKLTEEEFEFLKESLTIILDKNFTPIIKKPDQGYDLHQNFRRELKKFWHKNNNFDSLVEFGLRKIRDYNLNTGKKYERKQKSGRNNNSK